MAGTVQSLRFEAEPEGQPPPPLVTEMGGKLKGAVRMLLTNFVKEISITVTLKGAWTVKWKDAAGRAHEANRRLCNVEMQVFNGPLFKGAHAIPIVVDIPDHDQMSLPPSLKTITPQITAFTTYTLRITASWKFPAGIIATGGSSSKVVEVPLWILPSSSQRTMFLSNPTNINLSNIWSEIAPGTSVPTPPALAISMLFQNTTPPVEDPMSPPSSPISRQASVFGGSTGKWNPISTQIAPSIPIDRGDIRFELNLPRRVYLFGDAIPLQMVLRTRSPMGVPKKLTACVITLIAVQSFRLPTGSTIHAGGPRLPNESKPKPELHRRAVVPVMSKKFDLLETTSTNSSSTATSTTENGSTEAAADEGEDTSALVGRKVPYIRTGSWLGTTSASGGTSITKTFKLQTPFDNSEDHTTTSTAAGPKEDAPVPSMGGNGVMEVRHLLRISVYVDGGPGGGFAGATAAAAASTALEIPGTPGSPGGPLRLPGTPVNTSSPGLPSSAGAVVVPPGDVPEKVASGASLVSLQEKETMNAAMGDLLMKTEKKVMRYEPSLVIEVPITLLGRGSGRNREAVPYIPRGKKETKATDSTPAVIPGAVIPAPEAPATNGAAPIATNTGASTADDESEWEVKSASVLSLGNSRMGSLSEIAGGGSQLHITTNASDIDEAAQVFAGLGMDPETASIGLEDEEDDPAALPSSVAGPSLSQRKGTVASSTSSSSSSLWAGVEINTVAVSTNESKSSASKEPADVSPESEKLAGSYMAIYAFWTDDPNEVMLAVGDRVTVSTVYTDGWAFATNETKNATGFIPLHHLCREQSDKSKDSVTDAINTSISQKVEPTSDWRRLCQHEPRFRTIYTLMTSHKPDAGTINLPPAAHVTGTTKRMSSAWAEQERCPHCFNQTAPNAWN